MKYFFSVATRDKAYALPLSINSIFKFYPHATYTLVCPSQDTQYFRRLLDSQCSKPVRILSEDLYLDFADFKSIVNNIALSFGVCLDGVPRSVYGWYYQQILKLAFAISECEDTLACQCMIDSDTILLGLLQLQDSIGRTIIRPSNYERHIPYLELCRQLLPSLPLSLPSFTTQIFAISAPDLALIKSVLGLTYVNQALSYAHQIASILLPIVLNINKSLSGSYMSEQDIVGSIQFLNGSPMGSSSKFLRYNVSGFLSNQQSRIASLLGFQYVTYEKYYLSNLRINWLSFLFILVYNTPPVYCLLKSIQRRLTHLSQSTLVMAILAPTRS